MLISYNWLKELIDIDASVADIASQLTRVGLAVEGTHPAGDDTILDIDLTSNRSDCLSHLGVARELAAVFDKPLASAAIQDVAEEVAETPFPALLAPDIVKIESPDLCHRFTARIIKDVTIGPSPKWLVDRLEAIGERSINNVADITNYVMHELGQPMHAFDLDKLADNRIVVRTAREGETIKTLDEVERKLDSSVLAICDAEKPVAVAGIMGGFDSSITEATKTVLLEVAYFDRQSIRNSSRRLDLSTEASYRFERGVDIENLQRASDRALELITLLAGGSAGVFVDVYLTRHVPALVESTDISHTVKRLTGLVVDKERCVSTLAALGVASSNGTYTAPSWRHDIAIEEDLVEEVVRHVGYENIAIELPPAFGAGEFQPTESRKRAIRRELAASGFDEAISYSFISTEHDGRIETVPGLLPVCNSENLVELKQSVIEGAVRMRPTLIPGLLDAVRENFNHQRRDLRLFEIGKVFAAPSESGDLPTERELMSLVLTGLDVSEARPVSSRAFDFYDAKGAIETVLDVIGCQNPAFQASNAKHLRGGQAAAILVDGREIGSVGRLSEEIAANYKFKQPIYVAEIDLEAALTVADAPAAYRPLPRFPAVVRDVSLVVKRGVTFDQIRSTVSAVDRELLRHVAFVDLYQGKGLAADESSLTIRCEYRSDHETLTDERVDAVHSRVLETLRSELDVRPRE